MTEEEFKAIKEINDAAHIAFFALRGKVSEEYTRRLIELMRETDDLVDDLRLHCVEKGQSEIIG